MKFLSTFLLCLVICQTIKAQSIGPSFNNEYCPETEITFTVTVPGTYQNIIGNGGSYVTVVPYNFISSGGNTTFNFKGKFADVNKAQSFDITYSSGGTSQHFNQPYKKIKSLFYGTCAPIQPNRSSVTADLCLIQSFSISFNNVQWKTEFETPSLCFGSITTYEYLLPNGWQLGTTTSNGSTWIQANNSVTVTSDATTGNNQAVQIRAINTGCGAGLQSGPIVSIPIYRPAPPLSITGSATICYPNSYTYTLNGVPAGSSISWSNTNSYYNLSASGNTATVTPTSAANGSTTINATVTLSCGLSFPVSTTVSIGAPYVTFNITGYPYPEPSCYEIWGIYSFQAQQASGYPNTFTGYKWGWRNLTNNTVSNDPTIYGSQYSFIPEEVGDYEIWVRATNQCGASNLESVISLIVSNGCGGMRMQQNTLKVYPNPAKNKVTVQIPIEFRKNGVLQLTNQLGLAILTQTVNMKSASVDIDLSRLKVGIYQFTLRAGSKVRQAKILKQ